MLIHSQSVFDPLIWPKLFFFFSLGLGMYYYYKFLLLFTRQSIKLISFNNSLKNPYFCFILFRIRMPQTFSTCPYRFPLAKMCLVYPQKFECDIVPWFVTPCGIWPQHDQIDPFPNHKKGKSEWTILTITFNCYNCS